MEENKYRELLEQERRDHELAVRLAQESNGQVEDSPLPVRRYCIRLLLLSKFKHLKFVTSFPFFFFLNTNWRKVERAIRDNKRILI